MSFGDTYRNKRVLITGHTGFKGAWLAEWLLDLGAEVTGFALPPSTDPSLFEQLGLQNRLNHIIGDVRDLTTLTHAVESARPDFIFHLAAQPLVRLSYEQPVETYATNVLGTVNLLEAVRQANRPCSVVCITTDKCYQNKEWVHSYREEDPMGGHDPYSASKGAAEIVISSYRSSYFSHPASAIHLASARAGNVIGGGDWALDRIVPDSVRALAAGQPIQVRNKTSRRPWQHVLEPLSGYLHLAARLGREASTPSRSSPPALQSAFNFGPSLDSNQPVSQLVHELLQHWPGSWEDRSDPYAVHEANLLNLAIDKAFHLLHWEPTWNFAETIKQTAAWYRRCVSQPSLAKETALEQIRTYTTAAHVRSIPWAC